MALPEAPQSNVEKFLSRVAGESTPLPEPLSRIERYLAAMAGETVDLPEEPRSRIEQYLEYILEHGGGGVEVVSLTATENGTYAAPMGKAYSPVTVDVPTPSLDALTATDNGVYTPELGHAYSSVTVNIPSASGVSF